MTESRLNIQVDRNSEVPLHDQVAAQIVFLIATGVLPSGAVLPSVRSLALRLRIHRNTISRAYHDRVLNLRAEKHAGRRLVVRALERETPREAPDLDGVVDIAITQARRLGYSPRQVHERLLVRMRAAPPDRILVVALDAGIRLLLSKELAERFTCTIEACSGEELRLDPGRSAGALVVGPPGALQEILPLLAPEHPVVPIAFSSANDQLQAIRRLSAPSLVALVSVSAYFLEMALAVLAPAVGRRHSMRGHLLTGKKLDQLGAADLLLCDSLTYPIVRARSKTSTISMYRLISDSCFDEVATAIGAVKSGG